mmetsp:Transcript_126174/g.353317  ORF Transcript_126174/g.353317 Transcript_126174/m.353317 type:complete len:244 (+) Transcript_126174:78-809(+)
MGHLSSNAAAMLTAVVAPMLALLAAPAEAATLRFRSLRPPALGAGPHGFMYHGYDIAELSEKALFYAVVSSLAFAILLLAVCLLWGAIVQWAHWAHFRACQRKVQRVNEAFSKRQKELSLCPCCVEPIANHASHAKVVFLCGHRFHTECVNNWFVTEPSAAGRCPICEAATRASATSLPGGDASADGDGVNDEAQQFILSSLHRQFPEIIPDACLQKWSSCHTEIWLSELTCPRPKCILHKRR